MIIKYVDFKKELVKHFSVEPRLITECLIRYWFIEIHGRNDAEIEKPYRTLSINPKYKTYLASNRARADLYYGNAEDTVIEFKYHRKTKYSSCCTATNMGSVFNDLNRLSILDNKEKYLIYVFDEEMKKYYEKNSPFDILKISKAKVSPKIGINKTTDSKVAIGFEEFKKQAFSGFNCKKFEDFNYTVKISDIQKLVNGFYLIIYRVY